MQRRCLAVTPSPDDRTASGTAGRHLAFDHTQRRGLSATRSRRGVGRTSGTRRRRRSAGAPPAVPGPRGWEDHEMAIDALDVLYVPSRDVEADVRFYRDM